MSTYSGFYGLPKPVTPYTPVAAPKVSTSTPYGGQAARNTTGYTGTGAGSLPSQMPVPTQPTKTVAPSPAPQPQSAPAAPPAALYDYSTDPVLQQVQASATRSQQDADAAALAARKQLAIQYGDVDLANQIGDQATAAAAAANPYSVYGQLATQLPKDQLALDESLNKNNLFYSGARVNQQGDLLNTYGQNRATDAAQEQQALAGIDQSRLSAYQAAQQTLLQAENDAYNRYLQQLLANPPSTPSDASSGDTSGGGGGSSSPGGVGQPGFAPPSTLDQIAAAASNPGLNNTKTVKANNTAAFNNILKPKSKPKSGYAPGGGINT